MSQSQPVAAVPNAAAAVHYIDGPSHHDGDVHLARRYFSYESGGVGIVAGTLLTVACSLECSAKDAWMSFKDFNRWQNEFGYFYSRVVGDVVGPGLELAFERGGPPKSHYNVIGLVPEHLIVLSQPKPDKATLEENVTPGRGGVEAGLHSFMLTADGHSTRLTGVMQHSAVMADPGDELSEEQVIAPWRDGDDGVDKWRDSFIPNLKRVLGEATSRNGRSD